jgi:hypothetical protein
MLDHAARNKLQSIYASLNKYHWCLELIQEPPHCPVDRIVIGKTTFKEKLNWTEIRSCQKYLEVVEEIDKLAKAEGLSIAMWELRNYARR